MSTELPATIRVLLHWYKHTLAEVRGAPVPTIGGELEEYGDPDNCEICIAVTVGQTWPTAEELLEQAEDALHKLLAEAKRRGLV